jgi:hypothetical protein
MIRLVLWCLMCDVDSIFFLLLENLSVKLLCGIRIIWSLLFLKTWKIQYRVSQKNVTTFLNLD